MELDELTKKVNLVADNYAKKFKIKRDSDWYLIKTQEELGELTQHYLMMTGRGRKKGLSDSEIREKFEMEVADVLCMMLLLASHHKIDLDRVVQKKWLNQLDRKS